MDSSNSGSFQSSSGPGAGPTAPADTEEYDSSTPHSISSFFNHFNPNLNHLLHPPPPPPPQPPPPTTTTTFFTPPPPFSTYPINPNPSNTNKDHHHHQDHHPHHQDHQDQHHHPQDHHHQIGVTMKNPKKRTRASRRAPTTVLTTDTTNFRQMVQEFTGIPTSPFTASAFSRRLELFRPTAQKLQPPAPPLLNPMANNNIIVDSSTCNNNNNNNITSSSYQLHPSSINDLQKQPSTLLDLQNHPMLSFQSLLQTSVPQESSDLNGLQSTSGKRWRDQNEKLESFEDDNIVRSNVVVSSRSGGDQVQGNNNQRFMDLPF